MDIRVYRNFLESLLMIKPSAYRVVHGSLDKIKHSLLKNLCNDNLTKKMHKGHISGTGKN